MQKFLIAIALSNLFLSCQKIQDGRQLSEKHCGSCHLTPEPRLLPEVVWREGVFPIMSHYMGLTKRDYDHPVSSLSLEESEIVLSHDIYPIEPMLTLTEWNAILGYYLKNAKPNASLKIESSFEANELFKEFSIDLKEGANPTVTAVNIDGPGILLVGLLSGQIIEMDKEYNPTLITKIPMAPSFIGRRDSTLHLLSMGIMHPSNLARGSYFAFQNKNSTMVSSGLNRPVHMLHKSNKEIYFAEFGHQVGRLSFWNGNNKRIVLNKPGAVKILERDLNGDGIFEILTLFGQGDESVISCTYKNNDFDCKMLLQFHPLSGSSDMEIEDMNGDGYDDIVVAQGDNADYSMVPKDFHGIRIFYNNGKGQFLKNQFLSQPGCTNVEVSDFDKDGDIDLVASSFFPIMTDVNTARKQLIYYENKGSNKFTPYSLPGGTKGRWLVMDSGDIDNDGDVDLMLGSFVHHLPIPDNIRQMWIEESTDLLLLLNSLN